MGHSDMGPQDGVVLLAGRSERDPLLLHGRGTRSRLMGGLLGAMALCRGRSIEMSNCFINRAHLLLWRHRRSFRQWRQRDKINRGYVRPAFDAGASAMNPRWWGMKRRVRTGAGQHRHVYG